MCDPWGFRVEGIFKYHSPDGVAFSVVPGNIEPADMETYRLGGPPPDRERVPCKVRNVSEAQN